MRTTTRNRYVSARVYAFCMTMQNAYRMHAALLCAWSMHVWFWRSNTCMDLALAWLLCALCMCFAKRVHLMHGACIWHVLFVCVLYEYCLHVWIWPGYRENAYRRHTTSMQHAFGQHFVSMIGSSAHAYCMHLGS